MAPAVGGCRVAALAALVVAVEKTSQQAPIAYSVFLDQFDAGNVASVTFSGTEIDGQFKHPPANASSDAFRSRVPEIGDATLLPKLREEHVQIGVASSRWFGTGVAAIVGIVGAALLAKPMLLVVAAAFVAGLIRVARGGKMDLRSILSKLPMFRSASGQVGEPRQPAEGSPDIAKESAPKGNEMADVAQPHRKRPWYLRPLTWLIGAFVLGLVAFGVVEVTKGPAPISYGAFLDQLDAGNVADATLKGTQIDGNFKHPVGQAASGATASQTGFRSQIPDFGDPSLVAELRKERVAINPTCAESICASNNINHLREKSALHFW